jgi:hypothetical protein
MSSVRVGGKLAFPNAMLSARPALGAGASQSRQQANRYRYQAKGGSEAACSPQGVAGGLARLV